MQTPESKKFALGMFAVLGKHVAPPSHTEDQAHNSGGDGEKKPKEEKPAGKEESGSHDAGSPKNAAQIRDRVQFKAEIKNGADNHAERGMNSAGIDASAGRSALRQALTTEGRAEWVALHIDQLQRDAQKGGFDGLEAKSVGVLLREIRTDLDASAKRRDDSRIAASQKKLSALEAQLKSGGSKFEVSFDSKYFAEIKDLASASKDYSAWVASDAAQRAKLLSGH